VSADRIAVLLEVQHRWIKGKLRRMSRRQFEIVRAAMLHVEAELRTVRWGSWGEAERRGTLIMLARAVSAMTAYQVAELAAELPNIVRMSQKHSAKWLRTLDKQFHGSVRPLRFDTLAWWESKHPEFGEVRLREFRKSLNRYGAAAVKATEDALARNVLLGQPWWDARDDVRRAVRGAVSSQDWRVDRILRTETSAVYNGTMLATLQSEDSADDPMNKRLAATFDAATALDSVLLDGQIQPVGKPFYDSYHGFEYMAPPNRPNDREIVIGWRSSYGDIDLKHATRSQRQAAERAADKAARGRMGRTGAAAEVGALERQQAALEIQARQFTDPEVRASVKGQLGSVRRRLRALSTSGRGGAGTGRRSIPA